MREGSLGSFEPELVDHGPRVAEPTPMRLGRTAQQSL